MATLASDEGGYSPEVIHSFEGRGHAITLTVNPAERHVGELSGLLPLSLQLTVENAYHEHASKARWSISSPDGPQAPLQGGFMIDESWRDDGRRFANLTAYTPPFCERDEQEGCVPCDLIRGCQLEVSVDLCEPTAHGYYLIARVARDGRALSRSCTGDQDTDQCKRLSEWLSSEEASSPSELCAQ